MQLFVIAFLQSYKKNPRFYHKTVFFLLAYIEMQTIDKY